MKYLFLIIILISFNILFAQSMLVDSIYISEERFTLKSSSTFYDDKLFTLLYSPNRYIRIPIHGIPNNAEINEKLFIVIINSDSEKMELRNICMGNSVLGDEKKKIQEPRRSFFNPLTYIRKKDHIIIKQSTRYCTSYGYSSSCYGYYLPVGIYQLYAIYLNENRKIISNTVDLIVR